jgi:hypothetical protein
MRFCLCVFLTTWISSLLVKLTMCNFHNKRHWYGRAIAQTLGRQLLTARTGENFGVRSGRGKMIFSESFGPPLSVSTHKCSVFTHASPSEWTLGLLATAAPQTLSPHSKEKRRQGKCSLFSEQLSHEANTNIIGCGWPPYREEHPALPSESSVATKLTLWDRRSYY